jgi:DNA-directed RNA polymerase subunit beta'
VFGDEKQVIMAHECGEIGLHARIKLKENGEELETTVGRVIFNTALPEDYPFVNTAIGKKEMATIVAECSTRYDTVETAEILDSLKAIGYHYATAAGITIGIDDIQVPPEKWKILDEPEIAVEEIERQYRRGLITNEERHQRVVDIWTRATEDVTEAMEKNFDSFNPIYMMANSGARGNLKQIRQLAGMRGLVANPKGDIIDRPIKANFREGLTVLEYFISTHGARKGLADTALRTADSGYLTRRLVDVAQEVIIRENDCGTTKGIEVRVIGDEEEVNSNLVGRVSLETVRVPKRKEVIVDAGVEITEAAAEKMHKAGIDTVPVRTVLACNAKYGVCQKCYGRSLANGRLVDIGEAVGIIAAQSIGEPGTQLTMRTFHTGGVAGEDITHGLPRVVELFEARKPKGQAQIAEISGVVDISDTEKYRKITIGSDSGKEKGYQVSRRARLRIARGDRVKAGDQLIEGSLNPHDILRVKGTQAVQLYLVNEVQQVYRSQGVDINDKHVELIVRQMLRRVTVVDPGDGELLPGQLVDRKGFEEENEKVRQQGGEPATAKQVLLGITKASLATDSFLSAASFQETTRVLTDAAIAGKIDPLLGLKENVIIGKLIPAATGMTRYRSIKIHYPAEELETREQAIDTAAS